MITPSSVPFTPQQGLANPGNQVVYTPVPVPPPPPVKPKKPNMGTVEQVSYATFIYAFGGKPNPNFVGLQDEDSRKLRNTMYRLIDPTHDGKNNKLRESGLPHQFKVSPNKV